VEVLVERVDSDVDDRRVEQAHDHAEHDGEAELDQSGIEAVGSSARGVRANAMRRGYGESAGSSLDLSRWTLAVGESRRDRARS